MRNFRRKTLKPSDLAPYIENGQLKSRLELEIRTTMGETIRGRVKQVETKTFPGTPAIKSILIALVDLVMVNSCGNQIVRLESYNLTFDCPVVVGLTDKPKSLHLRSWGEYLAIKTVT